MQDLKEFKVQRETQEHLDFRDRSGRKVIRGHKGLRAQKEKEVILLTRRALRHSNAVWRNWRGGWHRS